MNFKELFEKVVLEKLDLKQALTILGFTDLNKISKSDLKTRYKDLAKRNHPDLGGNVELMQNINAANDLVSKSLGSYVGSSDNNEMSREEKREYKTKENKKYAKIALVNIEDRFDIKAFEKYFGDLVGKDIKTVVAKTDIKNVDYYKDSVFYEVEFSTKDNNSIFSVHAWVDLNDLKRMEGSLAGSNIDFNLYLNITILHDRRKVKLGRRSWSFSNDKHIFSVPNILFPEKKIQKIFKAKKTKFSKKDVYLTLEKEFKTKIRYGKMDLMQIPLHDDYSIGIHRSTFMRQGTWSLNSLFKRKGKFGYENIHRFFLTIMEDETSMEWLYENLHKLKKEKTEKGLINRFKKMETEYRNRIK